MSETWRDIISDAIRERLLETHALTFNAANEEARDLCDSIFDVLEVEPELQDVSWNVIARAIAGRNFSVVSP